MEGRSWDFGAFRLKHVSYIVKNRAGLDNFNWCMRQRIKMSSSSGKSFTGMALVVLALFGVGGALVDKFRHVDDEQKIVDLLPVKQTQGIAPAKDDGTQGSAVQKPGFVSANLANDGTGTLAGKAPRDTNVALELNGKSVKTTNVSKDGDFSIELEQPLAPGKYLLQLKSVAPPQGAIVQSDQQIKLNIRKDQDIVVTFLEPGQPPQILRGLDEENAQAGLSEKSDQGVKKIAPPVGASSAPKGRSGDQAGLMGNMANGAAAPSKADQPNILFSETAYIAVIGKPGEIKLSGTAQAGAKLNFKIDGKEIGRTIADQTGAWSFTTKQTLSPGAHMLLAEQLNDKGLSIVQAQVPFDRADAPSKRAPKSAWDRFTGIFRVEPGANEQDAQSGSDQPKVADRKKAASNKTEPVNSGSAKAKKGKLADISKSKQEPATLAAKMANMGVSDFAFEAVSYEVSKAGGGLLELSGRGIPGSRIRLFKGIQEIGEVVANSKGIWNFAKRRKMKAGPHLFRAGHVLKSGRIASEARMQYDHVAKVSKVRIAKGAGAKPTPSAKPDNGSAAKMTKNRVASYTRPSVSGEGADHAVPSGTKPSIATNPKMAPAGQVAVARSKIRKTAPRRASRAKKKRRKLVRRSAKRRSVKKRSATRYYLSRKNKARYMAKRKRYPKSRRTPTRVLVRNGTTLWGYSEHYYGRGRYYRHIQRANRRRIKNPNKIYVGQRIKVPRLRSIGTKRR